MTGFGWISALMGSKKIHVWRTTTTNSGTAEDDSDIDSDMFSSYWNPLDIKYFEFNASMYELLSICLCRCGAECLWQKLSETLSDGPKA